MNKWFAYRAWLRMMPDHWTAKIQPNPHRSTLEWGTWEGFKCGSLIQSHPSSLPCEPAGQPGGSCAPFKPHPQFGHVRSTAGRKCHGTRWRPLPKERHRLQHGGVGPVCLWLPEVNGKSLLPDASAGLTPSQRRSSHLQLYIEFSVAMAVRQHYIHLNSALKGVA